KIVGFYDSEGSNVIIAPKELVPLHGSDFDVDALFVIRRPSFKKDYVFNDYSAGIDSTLQKRFKGGSPIGYKKIDGKYTLDPEFDSNVLQLIMQRESFIKTLPKSHPNYQR